MVFLSKKERAIDGFLAAIYLVPYFDVKFVGVFFVVRVWPLVLGLIFSMSLHIDVFLLMKVILPTFRPRTATEIVFLRKERNIFP